MGGIHHKNRRQNTKRSSRRTNRKVFARFTKRCEILWRRFVGINRVRVFHRGRIRERNVRSERWVYEHVDLYEHDAIFEKTNQSVRGGSVHESCLERIMID